MTNKEKAYIIYKLLTDDSIADAPDFTEEEWDGLCGEAPMSFEMFISCLEKCAEGNYAECYFEILEQFPEYKDQLDDYYEREHGIKKMTPEETNKKWLEFKQRFIDTDE